MVGLDTRTPVTWERLTAKVCGGEVAFERGGEGTPLLVLPRDNGHSPHREFLDSLAAARTVYHPWYPGFHGGGDAAQWDWLTNVRDLAIVQLRLVSELGLSRPVLAGFGFGGWIAAEMASMSPAAFQALILVAPMGIQPRREYIYDQFVVSTEAYARRAFADEAVFERTYSEQPGFDQLEAWETDREMTSRLAWKPYMYNPALQGLLSGVECPALIAWGDSDRIVPFECGELYKAALENAALEVIAGSGHAVDVEQPAALAEKINSFLQSAGL